MISAVTYLLHLYVSSHFVVLCYINPCTLAQEFIYNFSIRKPSPVIPMKAANHNPPQSITTNTNRAQSESAELILLQCKIPPASPLLVKQQHPDARINVPTKN